MSEVQRQSKTERQTNGPTDRQMEIFLSPTGLNKKRKGKNVRDTQWKESRKKLTDK